MSEKPKDLDRQLVLALQSRGVDRVLDVGANEGQYARRLRRAGYAGRILSFEPLAGPRAVLEAGRAGDEGWELAPAIAVGATPSRALLHRSAESDMSSLLEQSALLRQISPSSAVVETTEVEVAPLQVLVRPAAGERLFLKVDVQGAENLVLDGLGSLWARLEGVQLELSLVALYEGETSYLDLCARLHALGFSLALVLPGYFDGKLRRQVQFDGVFLRRD